MNQSNSYLLSQSNLALKPCYGVFSQVSIHSGHKGSCKKLSSAGTDGQLITWDIKVSKDCLDNEREGEGMGGMGKDE